MTKILLIVFTFTVAVFAGYGVLAASSNSLEDSVARERIAALAHHVNENQKRLDQRFEDARQQLLLAREELQKRLESINEFRGQLRDQQAGFITKSEVEQRLNSIVDRLNSMQTRLDKAEGQVAGIGNLWGYIVGIVGVGFAAFSVMRNLRLRKNDSHG